MRPTKINQIRSYLNSIDKVSSKNEINQSIHRLAFEDDPSYQLSLTILDFKTI